MIGESKKFFNDIVTSLEKGGDVPPDQLQAALKSAALLITDLEVQVAQLESQGRELSDEMQSWFNISMRLSQAVGIYFDADVGKAEGDNCPVYNAFDLLNQV